MQKISHRNVFLLIASLVFYAVGEPFHIFIMVLSICLNFRFGLLIDELDMKKNLEQKKNVLVVALLTNLLILFLFKYEGFIVENINQFTPFTLESNHFVLPIGISFYTFQAISYVVDVYRGTVPVQKNLTKLGLYIAFFPQLIAGPIIRYSTVNEQIDERKTTLEGFFSGSQLFIIGVGKKVIFANNFSVVSEYAFGTPSTELSVAMAWLGAICYSLQIFFDFSGYSDMAIGLAKMFGFSFPKNFNYPYISKTVSEFWRRWHISLGSWFRDYVYVPMGGSRVSTKERLVFNLLVVWLCTGIWHGANWQFLIWGFIYFCVLTFEKLLDVEKNLQCVPVVVQLFYRIFVLLLVNFCWVIFGEQDLEHAFYHILSMTGLYVNPMTPFVDPMAVFYFGEVKVFLLFAVLASTPFFPWVDKTVKQQLSETQILIFESCKSCGLMLILMIAVSYLTIGAHNPFIYFNF
ncbi:MAG: MBOAT family O-acyltransferase [Bacillota bacterium]